MWSFGRKLILSFALSFVVLILVGLMSYRGLDVLTRASYSVAHTHEVLDHVDGLLGALKDAETGQRGFLLTGADAYLEPFTAAQAAIPRLLAELGGLVSDNPRQGARAADAARRIDAILKLHQSRIAQRRTSGEEAAVRVMLAGDDKRQMDDLRRVLGEMVDEERSLLLQRAGEVESASSSARAAIGVGTVAGLLLVFIAGGLLARTLRTQIGAAVGQVQRSSAELQTASTQQAVGARQTATSMAEITTTLAELTRSSREIAESALQVGDLAGRTADSARSGDDVLQAARDSIGAMKQQSARVVEHMLDLGRKARQIDDVLDLVVELAQQTNILAINATIEAVGAGESGARFSVVADEVRRLADRMGESAKSIRVQIEEVRDAVNATTMATETGSKSIDAGASQYAAVAAALTDIGKMVQRTSEAAREIGLSTQQQSTAVEQVNLALSHTAGAAKETEVSSQKTSQTAQQLVQMARGLMRLVQAQPVH